MNQPVKIKSMINEFSILDEFLKWMKPKISFHSNLVNEKFLKDFKLQYSQSELLTEKWLRKHCNEDVAKNNINPRAYMFYITGDATISKRKLYVIHNKERNIFVMGIYDIDDNQAIFVKNLKTVKDFTDSYEYFNCTPFTLRIKKSNK